MTDPAAPPTIADVFHYMYVASPDPYRFPTTLAALLGMGVDGLKALYDRPAPDPDEPDFARKVRAIAAEVGCAQDILAHLLRRWMPVGEGSGDG